MNASYNYSGMPLHQNHYTAHIQAFRDYKFYLRRKNRDAAIKMLREILPELSMCHAQTGTVYLSLLDREGWICKRIRISDHKPNPFRAFDVPTFNAYSPVDIPTAIKFINGD